MRMRSLTALGLAVVMAACGAGRPKPCGWYFAADRANVTQGPIRWLAGVWKGSRTTGALIWTRLDHGSMAGVWRRAQSDRFYTLREDGAGLVLVEITPTGATTTFDAVEQGERAVVFANPERGRMRFREVDGAIELTIETGGGSAEQLRFSREI